MENNYSDHSGIRPETEPLIEEIEAFLGLDNRKVSVAEILADLEAYTRAYKDQEAPYLIQNLTNHPLSDKFRGWIETAKWTGLVLKDIPLFYLSKFVARK